MRKLTGRTFSAGLVSLSCAASSAGMPSPLPTDFETVSRLTATTESRLQAISFFCVVLLATAFCVKLLWNGIQKDFPQFPRMRFVTAIKAVVLWGLVCVVVLTMISGARELMTPGAWVKNGATYKLTAEEDHSGEKPTAIDQRLDGLRRIYWKLQEYHWDHDYTYPKDLGAVITDEQELEVPGHPDLKYVYVQSGHDEWNRPLVYEPEIDAQQRFVLMASGTIESMTTAEIEAALQPKEQAP